MHTRLLPALIRSLLVLLLFVDFINASPSPIPYNHSSLPRSAFLPRVVPALYPPTTLPPLQHHNDNRQEGYIKPLADLAAGYNLKFKEYSKWIKESSKSIWTKQAAETSDSSKKDDKENYVSPYLTQFADKHDSWWSVGFQFGVTWRHVLWEVVPEWFRGTEPQSKEDMLLLRAMEQPSYMSVDELPDVFKTRIEELDTKDDGNVGGDGKLSPVEDVDDSWIHDI